MFKSSVIKLSAAYLAILMLICIFFSIMVYRVSTDSLEESFQRQTRALQPRFGPLPREEFEQLRNEQLAEGRSRIIMNLFGTNVLILVLGGAGSYLLAQRTLRPIEEALDAQSRFTADASHELRTPLTAMRTEIEVALRDKKLKVGEARELLDSNLEEIDKLRELASGLLTLSRQQNGDAIPFSELQLNTIAREAQERLSGVIAKTNTVIKTESDVEYPVTGDRESLIRLFVILLDNAIKYSKETPNILISIKQDSRKAVVQIKDEGIGIKASDLPHIFNRFYRADTSRSKSTEGYGLGLSIAKQIVDRHKGSINVSSTPGEGSLITVSLPIKPA